MDQHHQDQLLMMLTDAIQLVAKTGTAARDDRLLTASAWLRRARKLFREAQDLLELAILEREEGSANGGNSRGDGEGEDDADSGGTAEAT